MFVYLCCKVKLILQPENSIRLLLFYYKYIYYVYCILYIKISTVYDGLVTKNITFCDLVRKNISIDTVSTQQGKQ